MSESVDRLAAEALATGTLANLPEHLFVDGRFSRAISGERMDNFDPGTGKVFSYFDLANAADVDHAVLSSYRALMGVWRSTKPADRSAILHRAGHLMRRDMARLSVAETLDSGKTLQEAQWDVLASARMFEYYAGLADKLQGTTIPLSLDYLSMTVNEHRWCHGPYYPLELSHFDHGAWHCSGAGCRMYSCMQTSRDNATDGIDDCRTA